MMLNNRFLTLLMFFSMPLLASCATAIEGATQQVTFKTVGAEDAYCTIQSGTNDYRYDVRPPQTIWVQKSRKPMFVSCKAQGNRAQNVTVEPAVSDTTFLNGLNGGVGAGWDSASGALYKYPEEVVIDFTGLVATQAPLPAYENRDALDPRSLAIEYMGPDEPVLPSDAATAQRYKAAYDEQARMTAEKAAFESERQKRLESVDGGFYGDKGVTPDTPVPAVKKKVGKYTPPKTVPSELKDDESSSADPVSVAPLAEAVPLSSLTPAAGSADASVVPKAPTLAQPIFPSSTSF